MYKTTIFFMLIIVLASCNSKSNNESTDSTKTSEQAGPSAKDRDNPYEKILGSFVGVFGDNKIAMLITKAVGNTVEGRTVVGGNDRPFVGTIAVTDGNYIIAAKEPGDDKNDGMFNMTIKAANTGALEGNWTSFKDPANKKVFVLAKKAFQYDINKGKDPQASQRLLTEADVETLGKYDLELMRNEIFARHGYCFKKKELRSEFETEEWYVPHTTYVADELTAVEKKNIELIKRYEKYQEEFGDEFGR